MLECRAHAAVAFDLTEQSPRAFAQLLGQPLHVPGSARRVDHPPEVALLAQDDLGVSGHTAPEGVGRPQPAVELEGRHHVGATGDGGERLGGAAQHVGPGVSCGQCPRRRHGVDEGARRTVGHAARGRGPVPQAAERTQGGDAEEDVASESLDELHLLRHGLEIAPPGLGGAQGGDGGRQGERQLVGRSGAGRVVGDRRHAEDAERGRVSRGPARDVRHQLERVHLERAVELERVLPVAGERTERVDVDRPLHAAQVHPTFASRGREQCQNGRGRRAGRQVDRRAVDESRLEQPTDIGGRGDHHAVEIGRARPWVVRVQSQAHRGGGPDPHGARPTGERLGDPVAGRCDVGMVDPRRVLPSARIADGSPSTGEGWLAGGGGEDRDVACRVQGSDLDVLEQTDDEIVNDTTSEARLRRTPPVVDLRRRKIVTQGQLPRERTIGRTHHASSAWLCRFAARGVRGGAEASRETGSGPIHPTAPRPQRHVRTARPAVEPSVPCGRW